MSYPRFLSISAMLVPFAVAVTGSTLYYPKNISPPCLWQVGEQANRPKDPVDDGAERGRQND